MLAAALLTAVAVDILVVLLDFVSRALAMAAAFMLMDYDWWVGEGLWTR